MLSNLVEWHGGDSVSDFVSAGLQKVDPLKNTLDCGLPVTGFQAELPNCKYKHMERCEKWVHYTGAVKITVLWDRTVYSLIGSLKWGHGDKIQ